MRHLIKWNLEFKKFKECGRNMKIIGRFLIAGSIMFAIFTVFLGQSSGGGRSAGVFYNQTVSTTEHNKSYPCDTSIEYFDWMKLEGKWNTSIGVPFVFYVEENEPHSGKDTISVEGYFDWTSIAEEKQLGVIFNQAKFAGQYRKSPLTLFFKLADESGDGHLNIIPCMDDIDLSLFVEMQEPSERMLGFNHGLKHSFILEYEGGVKQTLDETTDRRSYQFDATTPLGDHYKQTCPANVSGCRPQNLLTTCHDSCGAFCQNLVADNPLSFTCMTCPDGVFHQPWNRDGSGFCVRDMLSVKEFEVIVENPMDALFEE